MTEVLFRDIPLLVPGSEALLGEELQEGRVVAGGPLRCSQGDPVGLGQQGLRPAVQLRGDEQLGHPGLEVLLFILVPVKWLPQLRRNVLWWAAEGQDR